MLNYSVKFSENLQNKALQKKEKVSIFLKFLGVVLFLHQTRYHRLQKWKDKGLQFLRRSLYPRCLVLSLVPKPILVILLHKLVLKDGYLHIFYEKQKTQTTQYLEESERK